MRLPLTLMHDMYRPVRLFGEYLNFQFKKKKPTVQRLPVHDQNTNAVFYKAHDSLEQITEKSKRTKLTEYFRRVRREIKHPIPTPQITSRDGTIRPRASELTYHDFPKYYTWDRKKKKWNRRVNPDDIDTVGRM